MRAVIIRAADGSVRPPLPAANTIMVMPYIEEAMASRAATLMVNRAGIDDAVVLAIEDASREGFIALANRAFQCTDSRYFGYVAQDAFAGRRWLSLAINTLVEQRKQLFGFNDGKWSGVLASFGLAGRDWAAKNYKGSLFHPGYRSHYADAELTVLAISQRSYCYNANSVLVEVDWEKDAKGVNLTDRKHYHNRAKSGFDGRVTSPELLKLFS